MEDIDTELTNPTDKRIFAVNTAIYRGYSLEKIWQMTKIDRWFLARLQGMVKMEQKLRWDARVLPARGF